MTIRTISIFLAIAALAMAGCAPPVSLWHHDAQKVLESARREGARELLPAEYASFVETFNRGESLLLEQDVEQADSLFRLVLLKGGLMQANLLAERKRLADEQLRLQEEAARIESERVKALALEEEHHRLKKEAAERLRAEALARAEAEAEARRIAERQKAVKERPLLPSTPSSVAKPSPRLPPSQRFMPILYSGLLSIVPTATRFAIPANSGQGKFSVSHAMPPAKIFRKPAVTPRRGASSDPPHCLSGISLACHLFPLSDY